jgi:hypothetical protein
MKWFISKRFAIDLPDFSICFLSKGEGGEAIKKTLSREL